MIERKNEEWTFISICCGLYWFAHSLTRPVIALFGLSIGASDLHISFILAIYAVIPLLLAIPIGGYMEKVGSEVLFRWGAWLMCLSGLLYILSTNLTMLILAQIIAGIGQLFVWLTVQVMITGDAKKISKTKRIATFSFYMALGQLLGPIIAGFCLELLGYSSVFTLYMSICLVLLISGYRIRKLTSKISVPAHRNNMRATFSLLKNKGVAAGLVASFVMLFIVDTRMSYVPLYLEHIDYNYMQIGFLLTVASGAGLLVKSVYERMTNKWNLTVILTGSFFLSIMFLLILPFSHNFLVIIMVLAVSGFSLAITQSVSMSLISEHTETSERGIAFGLRLLINRSAQLVNPLYFGFALPLLDYSMSFLYLGAIMTIFSVCAVFLLSRKDKKRNLLDIPPMKTEIYEK
ncbi:MFS transporter [Alkalicoccobacillus murimartini]|uniref:MFS family permease n=1 Tax=Alkalicoccobacillus murimartini TaxID=171685 RepID=A0ABT9YHK7_9BACI|nr:MFS transporter [Alkalicoccobacillus murimartini]MDQ0207353.1 MFS family permease [Alkalicoccobacillus murimartini]